MKTLLFCLLFTTVNCYSQDKEISKTLKNISILKSSINKSESQLDSLTKIIINSEIYKQLEPFYIKEHERRNKSLFINKGWINTPCSGSQVLND